MPSAGSPSRWRGAAASVATVDENDTGASRSPVGARAPAGNGAAPPTGPAAARAGARPEALPTELHLVAPPVLEESHVRAPPAGAGGSVANAADAAAATTRRALPELPLELRSLSDVLPPPDPRLLEEGLAEAAAARQRRALTRRALCHHPSHLPPSGTSCGEEGEGQEQSDALGNAVALYALYEATGGAGWGHWISGSSSTFVSSNGGWPGSALLTPANDPCLDVIGVSAGHWEGVGCVNGYVRHMYASPPLPPLPHSACLALRH